MDSYSYLYKRVLITSKARYEASRRLKLHSWCSQWTLTFIAVGQIVLSLLYSFDLHNKDVPSSLINVAGLFFSIAVLAYSLLLGMGDFSARASNIHQCGLQLAELARELNYKISNNYMPTEREYLAFVSKYYSCLNRHENHTSLDYLIAKYDYLRETNTKPTTAETINFKASIFAYRLLGFFHYILSAGIIIAWGMYMTEL
ncbi:SLATT domain-containing protein [Aeromonas veronii]|uniref:SLATT domain-containing protein n=1 Tax=Aeromonas veronii TaxID=654 RepID=UPI003D1F43C7